MGEGGQGTTISNYLAYSFTGQKCLFANACPDPDFRYLSNSFAISRLRNAKYALILQGLYLLVYLHLPELCAASLFLRSSVCPTYFLSGLATLSMT